MKIVEGIMLILIINTIVAVFYFLFMTYGKKNRKKGTIVTLLILFCPVVGFAFLCLSWVIYKSFELFKVKEVNLDELSFSKNKIQLKVSSDIQKNTNNVPLEETLLMASKKNKRDGFLSVLREDITDSIYMIKQAVNDEDSEISHYAASSLMDIISKFKEKENMLHMLSIEKPIAENKAAYIEHVISFLLEDVLSHTEKKKLMEKMDEGMRSYTETDFIKIKGESLGKTALLWGSLKEHEKASYWFKEAFITDPLNLEVYKAALKYHYMEGQIPEFKSLLEKLKHSSIIIDNETLELIRFFY